MTMRNIALPLLAVLLVGVMIMPVAAVSYYAYGDSVTKATGYADLNPDGSDCYIIQMRDLYDPNASADHNMDGGGMTSAWGLANIATHYDNETYYCIMFGLNDVNPVQGISAQDTLNNLLGMYNYANTENTTPIILIQTLSTPVPEKPYREYPYIRENLTLIQEGLRAESIPFVRAYDAVDTVPGNCIIDEADTAYLATDGVHLNVAGQQALADYLWASFQTPSAGFAANTTAALVGDPVQFTSNSTGYPSLYQWSFGDGATSQNESPVHTYAAPGTYSVSLTVTNIGGTDAVEYTDYITVYASTAYEYYQTVSYSAGDQDISQQDVVIHRSTGTAYEETADGLTAWHIYVGTNCRADYGDIRFTDATGSDLAYYLWPDYTSSSARFTVRMENADEAGVLTIKYGNPAAKTTSDGQDTFVLFDEFSGTALDDALWEVNTNHYLGSGGTASVSDGVLRLSPQATGHAWKGITSIDPLGQSGMMVETRLKTTALAMVAAIGDETVVGNTGGVIRGKGYGVDMIWGFTPPTRFDRLNSGSAPTTLSPLSPTIENETWAQVRFAYGSGGEWMASTLGEESPAGTDSTWLAEEKYLHLFSMASPGSGFDGVTDIDYVVVRTYTTTPPAATIFSGEREAYATPGTLSAGYPIYFQSTISADATAWLWSFGDGATSTERNPTHTYAVTGTYRVTLTATNQYGSRSATQTLHVFSGTIPDPTLAPTISPGSTPTLNSSAFRWDPETGYYTSYWFNREGSFIDVHGLFFSLMLPLTQIFGSWVFLIIWGTLCMGLYLYTQDTTMPFIVGILGGSMMAFLMGEDALVVMLLTMAFAGGGILAKVLLGRV